MQYAALLPRLASFSRQTVFTARPRGRVRSCLLLPRVCSPLPPLAPAPCPLWAGLQPWALCVPSLWNVLPDGAGLTAACTGDRRGYTAPLGPPPPAPGNTFLSSFHNLKGFKTN